MPCQLADIGWRAEWPTHELADRYGLCICVGWRPPSTSCSASNIINISFL